MKSTKHCCDICKKSFDTSAGLYKHRRGKHPETLRVYANFTCCWDRFRCSATFRYVSEYIDHLQVKHPDANVLVEELRFDCESDFISWKEQIERETKSLFVRNRGKRLLADGQAKLSFFCNRLGTFKSTKRSSKGDRKGSKKGRKFGSSKSTKSCPASMYLHISSTGQYEVKFIGVHLDHELDLNHVDVVRKSTRKSNEEYRTVAEITRIHNSVFDKSWKVIRNSSTYENSDSQSWTVFGSRKAVQHLTFQVKRIRSEPCSSTLNCIARCARCQICRCCFRCSCKKFFSQANSICAHIHYVCLTEQRELIANCSQKTEAEEAEEEEEEEVQESVENLINSHASVSEMAVSESAEDPLSVPFITDPTAGDYWPLTEIQREEIVEEMMLSPELFGGLDHDYSNRLQEEAAGGVVDGHGGASALLNAFDYVLVCRQEQPTVLEIGGGGTSLNYLGNPRQFIESLIQSKLSEIDFDMLSNERFQKLIAHIVEIPAKATTTTTTATLNSTLNTNSNTDEEIYMR